MGQLVVPLRGQNVWEALLGSQNIDTEKLSACYSVVILASEAVSEESDWCVYNGKLNSSRRGLIYRRTPALWDTVRNGQTAEFGEVVRGLPSN